MYVHFHKYVTRTFPSLKKYVNFIINKLYERILRINKLLDYLVVIIKSWQAKNRKSLQFSKLEMKLYCY